MHIEEVVLDGFKSYATRTVISGFDKQFNAITGQNGSGKSNVLDAICFVLGISNLSQVRVGNLQELVYKHGQAGVTKASVTIVFNNEEKSSSPLGYEQYDHVTVTRQVVIGGRNKYLINGHNAQLSRVQNLFHSVGLNVNNPTFLIMQGRITKVINMKPQETLAMLEEAAGTRMFQMKKEAAEATIDKKNRKVEEIDKVLAEEITPTLDRLRKERAAYMEWSASQAECERLQRFVVAHDYYSAEQAGSDNSGALESKRAEANALDAEESRLASEASAKRKELEALQAARAKELSGELRELETADADASKEAVRCATKRDQLESTAAAAEQEAADAASAAKAADKAVEKALVREKAAERSAEDADAARAAAEHAVENAQAQVAAAASSEEGNSGSSPLETRVAEAEAEAAKANAAAEAAKSEASSASASLKEHEKDLAKAEKAGKGLAAELDKAEKAAAAAEAALAKATGGSAAVDMAAAREEARAARRSASKARDAADAIAAELSQLDFSYADPKPGFQRERVKGVVAKLLDVSDASNARALEVAAGGKLFHVVVDTEETGKLLLSRGQLKRRVTIVPLSQIRGSKLDKAASARAAEVAKGAGGTAVPALSLVGFDAEISAAMEYVFGRTLVCSDSKSAQAVAFAKDVRARAVTLEGDLFEPSGTLTGGARRGAPLLARLHALAEARRAASDAEERASEAEKRVAEAADVAQRTSTLREKAELARHEADLVASRIASSALGRLRAECDRLRAEAEAAKATADTTRERAQRCAEELAAAVKARDAAPARSAAEQREVAAKALADARAAVPAARAAAAEAADALADARRETAALREDALAAAEQRDAAQSSAAEQRAAAVRAAEEAAAAKESAAAARAALEDARAAGAAATAEVAAMRAAAESASEDAVAVGGEARRAHRELQRLERLAEGAAARIAELRRAHPWIATERAFFGRANTDYDFEARDAGAARKRLEELRGAQERLARSVNKRAIAMFERAEQEFRELVQKKRIIERDRSKLLRTIEELETRKRDALRAALTRVDRDFGSIFSTLLPGASARLSPPEGLTLFDGLEMRVALGGVWKESLSELSGGQRSLLSLSLILAMLLFKPAPMYILDEVDAALDLNNTQNIGRMLRAHFGQSQFIVVSLKDGMFNNANVIFRTKFVDGVSTITRTSNNSASLAAAPSGGAENDGAALKKARSGAAEGNARRSRAPLRGAN